MVSTRIVQKYEPQMAASNSKPKPPRLVKTLGGQGQGNPTCSEEVFQMDTMLQVVHDLSILCNTGGFGGANITEANLMKSTMDSYRDV